MKTRKGSFPLPVTFRANRQDGVLTIRQLEGLDPEHEKVIAEVIHSIKQKPKLRVGGAVRALKKIAKDQRTFRLTKT